jgi:prephenate dehydrogenase
VVLVAAEEQAAIGGPLLWELAAGGFRDTTRVAGGEIAMWTDILLTNRAAVLGRLTRLGTALDALRAAVEAEDEPALTALLARAQTRRRVLFRDGRHGL